MAVLLIGAVAAVAAIVMTIVVTAFVLWRYQTVVLHGMLERSSVSLPVSPAPARNVTLSQALAVPLLTLLSWERAARHRIGVAYLASISVPALVLTGTYLVQSELPTTPAHFALVVGIIFGAAVPMIAVSLAAPFWRAVLWCMAVLLIGAVAAVAASILQGLAASKAPSLDQLMNFVYFFLLAVDMLFPTFLVYFAIGNRRLRGVTPIIFPVLLLFGLAGLVASTQGGTMILVGLGSALWLTTDYDGLLLLVLPAVWFGWRRLRSLARSYENKRFSDVQLLARNFWLIIVTFVALQLLSSGSKLWISLAGCTGAYLLFLPLNGFFLAQFDVKRRLPRAPMLLLLRVFGYRARTEQIFDRIVSRWRLIGPVTMTAAPDVVARTIDPGDFLRFVTGHTSDKFIRSQADLDSQLSSLDLQSDPDGRYRINDFCCSNNSWQATVVALIERADAVLMDVRNLTDGRRGCEFELQQLAARMPAQKVVLIVDSSTDRQVLEQSMRDFQAKARLLIVEYQSKRELDSVFEALLCAASSTHIYTASTNS